MSDELKSLFGYDPILYRKIGVGYQEVSDEEKLERIRVIIEKKKIKISNANMKSLLSRDSNSYRNIGEESKELTDGERYLKLREIFHDNHKK